MDENNNTIERVTELIVKLIQLEENEVLTFAVMGNAADAKAFVHRMRVRLSDMRKEVRKRKRTLKEFKMYLERIKVEQTHCTVVLRKSPPKSKIAGVLDGVIGDNLLDGDGKSDA